MDINRYGYTAAEHEAVIGAIEELRPGLFDSAVGQKWRWDVSWGEPFTEERIIRDYGPPPLRKDGEMDMRYKVSRLVQLARNPIKLFG